MTTKLVALYCRLSPRTDGSYEGVDLQEQWGRGYAARKWPGVPVEVFPDKGISAANGDHRPEYERLREWITGAGSRTSGRSSRPGWSAARSSGSGSRPRSRQPGSGRWTPTETEWCGSGTRCPRSRRCSRQRRSASSSSALATDWRHARAGQPAGSKPFGYAPRWTVRRPTSSSRSRPTRSSGPPSKYCPAGRSQT